MLESALYQYLSTHPDLAAIVGNRIYPGRLPDNPVLPAIVYARVATSRGVAHDGPLETADARFQFDAWGSSYSSVKAAADRLRRALLGFVGTMGPIRAAIPRQETETDLFEPDTGLYRVSVDYRIWHAEVG